MHLHEVLPALEKEGGRQGETLYSSNTKQRPYTGGGPKFLTKICEGKSRRLYQASGKVRGREDDKGFKTPLINPGS